jgi:anion-transporting  ArsA/GET3 family ATPase
LSAKAATGATSTRQTPELLDRRLLFVTGKGGVGRTTVAAAIALVAAELGKRTLLCEVDAKGNLADFLECRATRFREAEVMANLFAMSMDTEESLREYLRLNVRVPIVGRLGPVARAFDFVATAAPGVREILTIGKLCYEVREGRFDLVVVDAAPTGHVVSQLGAPEAINDLVHVGLVRQQTGWMVEILSDASVTGCCIVSTPEEMPVSETIDLAGRLDRDTRVDLAAVIVNRVLPELFGRREQEVFAGLSSEARLAALSAAVGGDAAPVLEAARLAVTMRRTRAAHLDHLRASIDSSVPMLYLPYLFTRAYGIRTTRQLAEAVSAELGY